MSFLEQLARIRRRIVRAIEQADRFAARRQRLQQRLAEFRIRHNLTPDHGNNHANPNDEPALTQGTGNG